MRESGVDSDEKRVKDGEDKHRQSVALLSGVRDGIKRANQVLVAENGDDRSSDARDPVPWHRDQDPAAWGGPTRRAPANRNGSA